jgi:hypothetical protein
MMLYLCPGGRARLVAAEMSGARGNAFEQQTGLCNTLAGFAKCNQANVPCNTCGQTSAGADYFYAAGPVVGSPVDPGVANGGSCKTIYNGTCDIAGLFFACDTGARGGGNTGNPCTNPPGPPPGEP